MPETLDRKIEALVRELVEASPPPLPASEVLGRASRRPPVSLRSGILRLAAAAAAVLAFGAIAFLVGRLVLPVPPAEVTEPPIARGTPAPEPGFATENLGEEVRLLPSSGEVTPDVRPDILVGSVSAVGRIEATDLEVFTWGTREESLEGSCLQVIGFRARHSICSAQVGPDPDIETPFSFPRLEATGDVIDLVVVWQVPAATSVVSLEAGGTRLWQRPVEGIAAFVVEEDSGPLVMLSAWDREGEPVGGTGVSMEEVIRGPSVDPEEQEEANEAPRVTWERSMEGDEYRAVVTTDDRFVALERSRGVMLSADGHAWRGIPEQAAFGTEGRLLFTTLATDGSRILLAGFEQRGEEITGALWISDDGERWDRAATPPGAIEGIAWTGQDFVAVGYASSGDGDRAVAAWVSPDGEQWERAPHDPDAFESDDELQLVSLAAGPRGIVAVGMEGTDGAVWYSPDGWSWQRVSRGVRFFGGEGYQVVHDVLAMTDGYLAVGGSDEAGAMAWHSPDGSTWEPVTGLGPGSLRAVTAVPGGVVGVGVENRSGVLRAAAWSSSDGIRWQRIPHDEATFGGDGNTVMYDVAFRGSRVVGVGFGGIWTGEIEP